MSKTVFTILFAGSMLMAQTIDRTKPPETPPIPAYKMPPLHETKLPNGLAVVLIDDQRFPLVTVRLSFQAGSKFDPNELPGLSGMVASLLTQGTKTRSFREIGEELASIGGSLDGHSSPDILTVGGHVLAENTPKLLDLLADVTLNASFPESEVQLRKQNRKQALLAQHAQPDFLAREKFDELVFGNHPYHYVAPTMESIDRMNQTAMIEFRDSHLLPNNAVLVLLGKLPPRDETMRLVREKFGSWKEKPAPAAPAKSFPESKRQLVLVDRPGSVQADIRIGELAATRTDPDYFPLFVGNAILGGGASSRLFNDVREEKGFAYDVHSELDRRKDAGVALAVTQVRNDVVEPAMEAVLGHLEKMGKTPVTAAELSDAKNYLSGVFLISLETQSGVADQVDLMKSMGLPNDFLEMFTAHVRSVEPDQIEAAAKKYFAPDKAAIVVVGDASKIEKPLEKFGSVQVEKAK
ncbi:MAG TPA: pitrilysin family protein [Bryobacteraceae bacterium]|nr:pitrilysin family protein [Bryobacteraceae bacterium]